MQTKRLSQHRFSVTTTQPTTLRMALVQRRRP
jgi:hypothetical protein